MKKISLLLILSLLFTLLVSCTPEDDNSDPNNGQHPDSDIQGSPGTDDTTPDNGNGDNDVETPGGGWGDETDNEVNTDPDSKPADQPDQGGDTNTTPDEGNNNATSPDKDENAENTDPPAQKPPVGTSVGYSFGHVELTDMNGNKFNTADYSGKIIVLNLWATWCPPCVSELPDFNSVASEYKDDVVIIAAHVSTSYSGASSFVSNNYPNSDIVFAYDYYDYGYTAAGGDGYVPYTAIIDANGVIIYSNSGAISHSTLINLINSAK